MTTFPFSQLTSDVKAQAAKYQGTRFITFVKPVLSDFQRFQIGTFRDIDEMLNSGWLVIDMTR